MAKFFTEHDDEVYTGPPVTDLLIRAAEKTLGVRLPAAYLELLRERNGGKPLRGCFPVSEPTIAWATDHIEIATLCGVGGPGGIDSRLGSRYLIAEWDYPDIGVVICVTAAAGPDTVMLDYSSCGPRGEPSVAYVDEDRSVRTLAPTFAAFVAGLRPRQDFPDDL